MRFPDTKSKLKALSTLMILAVADAVAQETPQAFSSPQASAVPKHRVIVSLQDRKLALLEEGRLVKIYPTAVGAPKTPTPAGVFIIANRVPNPTWYGPRQVVAPGKANPLGTRWIGLSRKGYGIHGTNDPASIGRRASHGCIRMRNRDVEELFAKVSPGDAVEFYAERNEELNRIFGGSDSVGR